MLRLFEESFLFRLLIFAVWGLTLGLAQTARVLPWWSLDIVFWAGLLVLMWLTNSRGEATPKGK